MPFAGLGLHVVLALLCAVHAIRSRQQMYWLFILFAFPLLGSIVYFFGVMLPNSRLERRAMKAVSASAQALDPQREVRQAQLLLDESPTAKNQMRLAAALLQAGQADDAAQQYERCLTGPFAADPDIRLGAAHALVECQRYDDALRHLEPLARERADFRPETVALLIARSYAGTGRSDEARAAFESAVERFGTFEAKAEYTIWAWAIGDTALAERQSAELDKLSARWNPLTRELNDPVVRRLAAAQALANRTPRAG